MNAGTVLPVISLSEQTDGIIPEKRGERIRYFSYLCTEYIKTGKIPPQITLGRIAEAFLATDWLKPMENLEIGRIAKMCDSSMHPSETYSIRLSQGELLSLKIQMLQLILSVMKKDSGQAVDLFRKLEMNMQNCITPELVAFAMGACYEAVVCEKPVMLDSQLRILAKVISNEEINVETRMRCLRIVDEAIEHGVDICLLRDAVASLAEGRQKQAEGLREIAEIVLRKSMGYNVLHNLGRGGNVKKRAVLKRLQQKGVIPGKVVEVKR